MGTPPGTEPGASTIIERLLRLLPRFLHERPVGERAIAKGLGDISKAAREKLGRLLHALETRGRVVREGDGDAARYRRPPVDGRDEYVVGRITRGRAGEAKLKTIDRDVGPIVVPNGSEGEALPGDLVLVRAPRDPGYRPPSRDAPDELDLVAAPEWTRKAYAARRRAQADGEAGSRHARRMGPRFGSVVHVIEPRESEAIGVVTRERRGRMKVKLQGPGLPGGVLLAGSLPAGVREGTLVRVEVLPERDKRGRDVARFIEIVGDVASPDDDPMRIIGEFGLRLEYEADAVAESARLTDEAKAIGELSDADVEAHVADAIARENRRDLRALKTVTIDPDDAKDYDDAIGVTRLPGGGFELAVHIADVSHWVRPGGALDVEARARGCTAYLPGRTLHMLPGEMAKGVCSLTEGHWRRAKTVIMKVAADGEVVARELLPSVIENDCRLTYGQVLEVLEDRADATVEPWASRSWLIPLLHDARALADLLRQRRRDAGALELDIRKPHVTLDDDGIVLAIKPEQQDTSHNLVEECMLAANEAVARTLIEYGLPYLCRAHAPPEMSALDAFADFLAELEYDVPPTLDPRSLSALLRRIEGSASGAAVHLALLKSMNRATYEAEPVEHYALQKRYYTHFTSPIRRYPDLIVHQLLDACFEATASKPLTGRRDGPRARGDKPVAIYPSPLSPGAAAAFAFEMPAIAAECSELTYRADIAELRLTELKVLRSLAGRIGWRTRATVVAPNAWGPYCQLDEVLVEGQLRAVHFGSEWVDVKRFSMELQGCHPPPRTRVLRVGDRLDVAIERVDVERRFLDLEPVFGKKVTREDAGTKKVGKKEHRKGGAGNTASGQRKGGKKRAQESGRSRRTGRSGAKGTARGRRPGADRGKSGGGRKRGGRGR